MELFTAPEKIVLDMIPTIAEAAGLHSARPQFEEKQSVGRHLRFETEIAEHSILHVWDPVSGNQVKIVDLEATIALNSDFGLREQQIVKALVLSAIRHSKVTRGQVTCFSRLNNVDMILILNRVRLVARKHHPFGDIGDNCFISYVDETLRCPIRQFARIRFLGLIRGGCLHDPVQVVICQHASIDAEATESHGLVARRLTLQTFGHFQLPTRCFPTLQLEAFAHDCAESTARGTPCSFVNDVQFTSFQTGRKRWRFPIC
jgi:hypothetical protein